MSKKSAILTRMRPIKAAGVLSLLLLPSIYLACRFAPMDHLGALGDDGIYVVGAKSLAEDQGYRIPSLPDEPWQTKYPILFPLALAALWKIHPHFPANLPLIMAFCWVLLPVFLALSLRVATDLGIIGWRRYLLCAMIALNPMVLLVSVSPMSEMLFSCLLTGSLILIGTAAGSGRGWGWALGAGLAAGAAYLTRTAGVALLLVGPVFLLRQRHFRKAAAFLCGMAPAVAGWSWWVRGHVTPVDDLSQVFYTDYFRLHRLNMTWEDVPQVIITNIGYLFQAMGGALLLMPDESRFLRLGGIVVVIGFVLLVQKHGFTQYHLFACAYCLLLLMLPYTPNERFLVPVMPVLLAGVVASLRHRALSVIAAAGLAILCAAGIAGPPFLAGHLRARADTGLDVEQACLWIERSAPKDAQFISAYDTQVYLRTGRRGIAFQIPTSLIYKEDGAGERHALGELPQYARAHRFDYVLTTADTSGAFMTVGQNAIAAEIIRKHFDPVFRTGQVVIYRLRALP